MKPVVRCEDVSKLYHLGVTRTSILTLFSNSVKGILKYNSLDAQKDKTIWALRDINFELSPGESLGVIGQNGAGKSTLLKILANITRPTTGQVDINGRLSALIELGSGFHPELTGRENIYLNGTILGLSQAEIKNRFDEIVAFSEIEPFLDTPVKRYSSGMLVRLGFSVAACIEPEILLVDEVLAVGDASFRQKCIDRIQAMLQAGISVIFVSHNLVMVHAICPTALYIKNGQIESLGISSDVITRYEQDIHDERALYIQDNLKDEQNIVGTSVHITGIEIWDANSLMIDFIQSDQPVEIRVHCTALQPIDKANAVILIIRSDGLTCCRLRTSVDGFTFSLNKGSSIFSIFLEPVQLNTGKYFITASIMTEMDLVQLATSKSNWFSVSGAPDSASQYSGVFEPNRRWCFPEYS